MQSQAIPSNPAVSRDKRRPHMQFARHGLWVNEWVATAGEKVPEFLQVPTGYLDKSSDLNASELRCKTLTHSALTTRLYNHFILFNTTYTHFPPPPF
ncbi:hypothetical protein PSTT_14599 [Puccinia striiformis]|uniref:Uncharacterized protein n=1 Tax=Puccinia striiformis TaxID=27350 RepID=A0A2S4ULH5_9BASI|nr:hypothetical protein PSTT_14599 [Puccinia striiformis]